MSSHSRKRRRANVKQVDSTSSTGIIIELTLSDVVEEQSQPSQKCDSNQNAELGYKFRPEKAIDYARYMSPEVEYKPCVVPDECSRCDASAMSIFGKVIPGNYCGYSKFLDSIYGWRDFVSLSK